MKIALQLSFCMLIAACGDSSNLSGNFGTDDETYKSELKGDLNRLGETLRECGKSDRKECVLAREVQREFMYANPVANSNRHQTHKGGLRDIQK